jgi:hypothetical protein
MWLVLSESGDTDAVWARHGLRARGLAPVELVTVEELVAALRWDHRLDAAGCSSRVELADGRTIEGDLVQGALNRLVGVRPELLGRAVEADRDYAVQELYAFFLSWLAALPGRILNRPSPQGLAGAWLERSEWLALAVRAGLEPEPYRRSSVAGRPTQADRRRLGSPRRTVLVVGDRALGPPGAPVAVVHGCGRLSRSVGAAILGVEFVVEADGRWIFEGATTLPSLRRGGERALDLLASALTVRLGAR